MELKKKKKNQIKREKKRRLIVFLKKETEKKKKTIYKKRSMKHWRKSWNHCQIFGGQFIHLSAIFFLFFPLRCCMTSDMSCDFDVVEVDWILFGQSEDGVFFFFFKAVFSQKKKKAKHCEFIFIIKNILRIICTETYPTQKNFLIF